LARRRLELLRPPFEEVGGERRVDGNGEPRDAQRRSERGRDGAGRVDEPGGAAECWSAMNSPRCKAAQNGRSTSGTWASTNRAIGSS
jgi:hypothetical protein